MNEVDPEAIALNHDLAIQPSGNFLPHDQNQKVDINAMTSESTVTPRREEEHGLDVRGLGKNEGNETPPQNPANLYHSGGKSTSI